MGKSRKRSSRLSMPRSRASANGHGGSFVLLASRFNGAITQALVDGASQALRRHGIPRERIRLFEVPGAFELPVAAATVAKTLKPHAIIALGCVIKGDTPQYAAIGHAVAQGLVQVSVNTRIPVSLGVIVADSFSQAKARAGLPAPRQPSGQAGGAVGNRGEEAALAALEMVGFIKELAHDS